MRKPILAIFSIEGNRPGPKSECNRSPVEGREGVGVPAFERFEARPR